MFCVGDMAVTIIKGPLGALLGIVYGFGAGIMLWFVPGKDSVNTLQGSSLKHHSDSTYDITF